QKIFNDLGLRLHIALDRLDGDGSSRFVELLRTQELDPAKDRSQRSSQFVRERRQELIFQTVDRFGFLSCFLLTQQQMLALILNALALGDLLPQIFIAVGKLGSSLN